MQGSRHFLDWLAEMRVSLAFSTYQTGKVFFVGRKLDTGLAVFERTFNHCMGLWASPDGRTLWLSSKFQVWRFEQAAAAVVPYQSAAAEGDDAGIPAWAERGYDVAYVPRVGYTTGDLDVHDIAVDANGRVIFVCTLFGCLATLSERASFQPLWRPPFLSALVPEDRCHLNGLAMRDGRAAYVTAVADSDVADGWRDRRHDGGCVVDVASGEIVARGLSMPHSPRWYRDRLWLVNSGTGEFGTVDLATGQFEPIAFCPGYLRGLAFVGDYAVVTLSKPRHVTFHGLALDDQLKRARGRAAVRPASDRPANRHDRTLVAPRWHTRDGTLRCGCAGRTYANRWPSASRPTKSNACCSSMKRARSEPSLDQSLCGLSSSWCRLSRARRPQSLSGTRIAPPCAVFV